MIGRTLAHYRVVEQIGSGGMGKVYRAEDTKLSRDVALKVLPAELADNEERRARFEREAKAVGALNHPNIVTVHSVEEVDGVHFLAMELVRGETVGNLLPPGGFSVGRFLEIAIPLSDAVAAAHSQGITHRDLKPDNVMVSDEGRIKVLDFGLAKPAPVMPGSDSSDLPTEHMTREGRILGTLSYMSPEQAEGKAVDARSDIFSLGVIFYEMLTGRRPFHGDTPASTLSAIIKDTPESLSDLSPAIPRDLAKIVRRCLAKDPERRFQSAKDLRNELEELREDIGSGEIAVAAAPARRSGGRHAILALSLAAAVVVGFIGYRWLSRAEGVPTFTNPVQVTSDTGLEDYPTWSPEGSRVAYMSNRSGSFDIWVSQVAGGGAVNLTAEMPGRHAYPSWSPDGSQIAFYSSDVGMFGCQVMSALGGGARQITSHSVPYDARPQWSSDGRRLACASYDDNDKVIVEIVSLETLEVTRVRVPGAYNARDLAWSRDSRWIAYVDAAAYNSDTTRLWVVRLSDGEAFPITDGADAVWSPSWSPDARFLYYVSNRGGSMDLWRQRIDDGGADGEPEPVTTGLEIRSGQLLADGSKLAYSKGRRVANIWRVPVLSDRVATWSDAEQITFDQAYIEYVHFSTERKQLVINSNRAGSPTLWIVSLDGQETHQLTTGSSVEWAPVWSPDGSEIAFYSNRSGNRDIWVMPSDGGLARQLTFHEGGDMMPSWSPDGREIAYTSVREGNWDIWVVPAAGGDPRRLTEAPGEDNLPTWSPDGQWIYFSSDRDGTYRLSRVPSEGGTVEAVTRGVALRHRWAPGGNAIYFLEPFDNAIGAVSPEGGDDRVIADLSNKRGILGRFALATDGESVYFTWEEDLGDIWVMDVVD